MGQKIHPEGFRVGYIHDWKSNWFNEREFADYLLEDIKIREHIETKLGHGGCAARGRPRPPPRRGGSPRA